MNKIKSIVFDFGGVLLDWNPRYVFRSYFNNDEKMEYFLGNICTNEWNGQMDAGLPFDEGVRQLEAQYPEYSEPIRMFRDKWKDMLKTDFPQSVALLKQLKALDYGIYGLTNWSAETIGVAFSRYDFFKLFDGIVVSGEEKVIKPSPEIYKILLRRYNLTPGTLVFIDDNPANLLPAAELGFHTVHFDTLPRVTAQLSTLLGINL